MMLGFLLSGTGRAIAIATVAIMLLFGALWQVERRAAERAAAKVERANAAKMDAADAAEQRVLTCPPGLWDRERRICVIKSH